MNKTNNNATNRYETIETEDGQILQRERYDFGVSRRGFVQGLGAGIVIASTVATGFGQRRGGNDAGGEIGARVGGRGGAFGGGGGASNLDARLHIGKDGVVTVFCGKVEGGQGARAEVAQAAAEELRLPIDRVHMIMGDTGQCPDDGGTYGSQTTPRTLPAVRGNCAAARDLLIAFAAKQWNVAPDSVTVKDGTATSGSNKFSYADLAANAEAVQAFKGPIPQGARVTSVSEWKVMGIPTLRPNSRDLVIGVHEYPSAVIRPGMLYGKILRRPTYNAKLKNVDVSAAKAMEGVVVVQDGDFIGVAAPTTYQAKKAIQAIEKTAEWDRGEMIASKDVPKHLRDNYRGGMPPNPFAEQLQSAAKRVKASYDVPYIQHAPLEPRSAVAEWDGDAVTIWHGGQNPFGVRNEVSNSLRIGTDKVRIITTDFGAGFGGKHTGECAVEAARLAQAAKKPVSLRWTREEEFTFAAFRSAAAIDIEASLDAAGKITSWFHVVAQGSNAAPDTPYRVASARSVNPQTSQVLRLGSYRALGAPANVFGRESFMDELALAAGKDPLQFRLDHLDNPRLRAVLEDVAKRFDWTTFRARKQPNVGVGLACGTDKGGFVATAAEVEVDPSDGKVKVRKLFETFECGAIVNPPNLLSQVQGAMIQALGPALREAMEFEDGVILNASFFQYKVPRFSDLPELSINLLNRPDLPSAGAGETPAIAVGAAIANAVAHATGQRIRHLPVRVMV
jgi:isoquinoline 1-oxidoreductase